MWLFVALACPRPAPIASLSPSDPASAVRAFVAAAVAEDRDALQRLFSPDAPGEFSAVVAGTAPEASMEGLGQMFLGATVGEVVVNGDRAQVGVVLPNHPRGEETLLLIRDAAAWRILDF